MMKMMTKTTTTMKSIRQFIISIQLTKQEVEIACKIIDTSSK